MPNFTILAFASLGSAFNGNTTKTRFVSPRPAMNACQLVELGAALPLLLGLWFLRGGRLLVEKSPAAPRRS